MACELRISDVPFRPDDAVVSEDRDKSFHDYQQPLGEALFYVKALPRRYSAGVPEPGPSRSADHGVGDHPVRFTREWRAVAVILNDPREFFLLHKKIFPV
jgi:hypothetical protein